MKKYTSKGDDGDTTFTNKKFSKGHALAQYSAALDIVAAHAYCIPNNWGDYNPNELVQQLLHALRKTLRVRAPRSQELAVVEIGKLLLTQIEYISAGLKAIKEETYIIPSEFNHDYAKLQAFIRDAEVKCVAANMLLELESRDTSTNLRYMLTESAKILNMLDHWVVAFGWVHSTDGDGKLLKECSLIPWDENTLKLLND